jgi:hypothetical protein
MYQDYKVDCEEYLLALAKHTKSPSIRINWGSDKDKADLKNPQYMPIYKQADAYIKHLISEGVEEDISLKLLVNSVLRWPWPSEYKKIKKPPVSAQVLVLAALENKCSVRDICFIRMQGHIFPPKKAK